MPKSPIVEHWFRGYESPMKAVVLAMREILHAADPRLEEQLKWQSPTFVLGGGHLASFFPGSRDHARLMFPLGARIPGEHPHLEVSGASSRVMRVRTLAEVEDVRAELTSIVRAWARLRLAESERPPASKAPASKAPASKAPASKAPASKASKSPPSASRESSRSATKAKRKVSKPAPGMQSKAPAGTSPKPHPRSAIRRAS
jgi:hypothetical protein